MRDIRFNNYHIVDFNINKWSTNWQNFPGISYLPLITEWEENKIKDIDPNLLYLQQKWYYALYISIVYVILIRVLKNWMKLRGKPYQFRIPLIIWNTSMAIFSIIGVIRCLPEFIHILRTKGLFASFCHSDYFTDARLDLWYWLFIMSKVPELIDTIFIVLRGGKLIYLHWVHHALTLSFCWFVYGDVPSTARWMVNMNFLVHSLMYTHYALKAMHVSVPIAINVCITSLQIVQMVFGIYIHYTIIGLKIMSKPCDCSFTVAMAGVLLYTLFLILFVNFFIRTYILRQKRKKEKLMKGNAGPDKEIIDDPYSNLTKDVKKDE